MFLQWANDIEEDEKYKRWPSNIHELLRPAFPGTLRRVRKNMFHLVFVVDPLNPDTKQLVEAAEIYWANDMPLRIGVQLLARFYLPQLKHLRLKFFVKWK